VDGMIDERSAIMPPLKEVDVIKPDLWLQAKMLRKEGCSKSEIARLLSIDRKTVRKALQSEKPPSYPVVKRSSKLDPFKDYIKMRLADGVLNAVKLLREIKQRGYTGKVSILRDFVRPLKQEQHRQAWLRFETVPGEQAQVDWGHFYCIDSTGKVRRCYCFTMILGFSRCLYAEFTSSMDLLSLLRCHINAFDYFGGHTRTILYDNMKQVLLFRDETGQLHFHPRFLDFACYYGFQPKVCQPYRPQTKGKVENSIKYIRQSFSQGEPLTTIAVLNHNVRVWLDSVANVRIHATTQKEPFERRKQEVLVPLPAVPYDTSRIESRIATKDCFISYHGNRYSVPARYIRQALTVRDSGDGQLRIYCRDKLIATHRLSTEKGQMILNPVHTRDILRPKSVRPTAGNIRLPAQQQAGLPALVAFPEVLTRVVVARRPLTVYEELAEETP